MDTIIKLDKNYKIVTPSQGDNIFWVYKDDLNEKIERILKLKEAGKIDNKIAKQLIKLSIAKYLEKDIELSVENLFQEPQNDKTAKVLYRSNTCHINCSRCRIIYQT